MSVTQSIPPLFYSHGYHLNDFCISIPPLISIYKQYRDCNCVYLIFVTCVYLMAMNGHHLRESVQLGRITYIFMNLRKFTLWVESPKRIPVSCNESSCYVVVRDQ